MIFLRVYIWVEICQKAMSWDFVCSSHRGDVSGEVMCNMGISADISQTEVLVGAPGSYVWQGQLSSVSSLLIWSVVFSHSIWIPLLMIFVPPVCVVCWCVCLSVCVFVCVYVWLPGNVHVSWENPEIFYNPEQSSFPNMDKRHTYIGTKPITYYKNQCTSCCLFLFIEWIPESFK